MNFEPTTIRAEKDGSLPYTNRFIAPTFRVNRFSDMNQLATRNHCDVEDGITEETFPWQRYEDQEELRFQVVQFTNGFSVGSATLIKRLESAGMRPANLPELFAFT